MTFPSLWLGLGLFVLVFVAFGVLGARAAAKDPLFGQRRLVEGDAASLFYFLMTPAWYFALTGEFPWTYALGAVTLYVITGVALWFAFRAAGMPRIKRLEQTTCLNAIFMKVPAVLLGCLLTILVLVIAVAFPVVAYQTAARVDLETREGLFEVAIWVFAIPTAVNFGLMNVVRLFQLFSAETAQQLRVQSFALALRQYVLAAWAIIYPFLNYQMETLENNPSIVIYGVVSFLFMYLVLVVFPYVVGRTRFVDRSREVMQRLDDVACRVIVATDPTVSAKYRDHAIERVVQELRALVKNVVSERPFFQHYFKRVSGPARRLALSAEATAASLLLPSPAGTGQSTPAATSNEFWDKIIDKYSEAMPTWDYRLYLIVQIEEMLEQFSDTGWLRGSAMATRIEVARWLNRHYTRSVVLASVGVVVSAGFALVMQAYIGDLRAFAEDAMNAVQPAQLRTRFGM